MFLHPGIKSYPILVFLTTLYIALKVKKKPEMREEPIQCVVWDHSRMNVQKKAEVGVLGDVKISKIMKCFK